MRLSGTLCWLPILLVVLSVASSVQAENWPQWRGPHFNGSTDEKNLPVQWSRTENVAWSFDLPGASAATPVVWGDRVFVSTTDAKNECLKAICIDRKSGKKLWEHQVATGLRQDTRSNFASPSPATDGKLVVFFFGTGDLVAFDFQGKKLWSRDIQKDYGSFAFLWTFSSSPVLSDGRLFLQVLQRDTPVKGRGNERNESFLLAFNSETGDELWRHVRPSDAVAESRESFATPVPFEHNGRHELLVAGGDVLTGHDPSSGKELWRSSDWNPEKIGHWRLVPSPVAGGGVVLACAPKGSPIYAVRAGENGNLGESGLAWTSEESKALTSDVATPAFYDGDFFILRDVRNNRQLSRVNPKDGSVKWNIRLPGRKTYEASPLAADGKLYLVNFDADVVVVDAKNGKILNNISMLDGKDNVRSSIIAAQGHLFVRTNEKLYCIGK